MGGCNYHSNHYIVIGASMKLHYYLWHSINLIPMLAVYSICQDDENYDVIGRSIELVLFGWVIVFTYPTTKIHKMWSSHLYGPLWSRKRKKFYFVSKNDYL
jgi:hypothetical protein